MIRLYHIDSFTDRAYHGNPAAVLLLEGEMPANWMQSVASEMNLSETAFVWKKEGVFGLRWFTPSVEVRLCGHATLAAAYALLKSGMCLENEVIRFSTMSGILICRLTEKGMTLDFPSDPTSSIDKNGSPENFTLGLGLRSTPAYVGFSPVSRFALVEVSSEDEVVGLSPDFAELSKVPALGIIVTAKAQSGASYDIISRFFAPGLGILEDPVTGAAHCCLAPFWAQKLGKNSLRARQASARGGELDVTLVEGSRVILAGKAVVIFDAELSKNAYSDF